VFRSWRAREKKNIAHLSTESNGEIVMIGRLVAVAFAFASLGALAQEPQGCPRFQESTGTTIFFKTDDVYRKYGFQMFRPEPAGHSAVPYELLAGRKGKVVGRHPGEYGFSYFHEVLLDDCRTFYWRDTDGRLEAGDALSGGVEFLDRPPTEWRVREESDRMTDARSCAVTPEAKMPYPMFFYHSEEGVAVGVVGGDFPGRPATFRVDSNRAISENERLTGARAVQLIEQIRSGGKQLLVGSYEWPNDYEVIKEFNLSGIIEQLDKCKQSVGR